MWTAQFWKDATERAVRTAAQVLLSFFVVGQTGILDVDWQQALSVTAVAAIASVLTSLVGTGFGDPDTPSFVKPPVSE